MVHLIQPNECNHVSCDGESNPGVDNHTGELLFGGYYCLCNCHDSDRLKNRMLDRETDW